MGRPEQPIDPARGPLQQFAHQLRELRSCRTGNTYRAMSERAHYSASTLARAAGGRELPSLEVVTAYVAACGGDVQQWTERWHRLQRDLATGVEEPKPRLSLLPYQLPADLSDFAGRAAETDELYAVAVSRLDDPDRRCPTVLGITGAPGLGKTALAVHLAHRLAPEFPDGQLFVNMRGFDERRLEPETVLRQCVRALGYPSEQIPTDPDELASAYRSLLGRRRCLLVFDNARCQADLRSLLPGAPDCLVIVTSRSNLVGMQAARLLRLEPFTTAESVELLGRLAGAERMRSEPRAAAELAELCGRFPLALRIAGARLASRPQWKIATLTDRLRNEHKRLSELEAGDLQVAETFQMSYRALEAPARLVFRRLGALFPGVDFTPEVAGSLAGIDTPTAEDHLEDLVDANLLQSERPRRYQMHDLIRLYASSRWLAEDDADEADRAVGRMLRHYVGNAAAATKLLMPNWFVRDIPADSDPTATTLREALCWHENERHNISALVRFAAEAGEHELAWRLAYAAGGYYVLRRHWRSYATTHETALASAQQLGDEAVAAALMVNLGAAYIELGRSGEALELQSKAVGHFESGDDPKGLVHALNSLSCTYVQLERVDEAVELARRGFDIARFHGNAWGEGTSLCAIGRAYVAQGRFEMAIQIFRAALDRAETIGSRWAQMRTRQIIAETCREMGDLTRSMVNYRTAIDIAVEIGDQLSEGRFLFRLGNLHHDRDEIGEAREVWSRAEAVLAAIGDPLISAVRQRIELSEAALTGAAATVRSGVA
ncbi:hypothetical protein GCM10027447_29770 [Glycomyces halotolerans]